MEAIFASRNSRGVFENHRRFDESKPRVPASPHPLIPFSSLLFGLLSMLLRYLNGTSVAFSGLIDAKDEAHVLTQTVTINRKLKEKHEETTRNRKANEAMKEEIEEDYPQFDPAPSTKAAVKSGPIVHDTSVMPYVPISTPPDHPMKGHP